MVIDDGVYTTPKGETYQINRDEGTSFYYFTACLKTKGRVPSELSGSFTDTRFLHEAVKRFEARPEVAKVAQRKVEKSQIDVFKE